jgi:RNA polymerase sigma-70 factor (ECF subfamily)
MPTNTSKIAQPESELIERCIKGDQIAFGMLVEKMQTYAFNLAFRILLNDEDAKDAVQDSFIKVWKNISGYQSSCLFSTWMYKIVVNTCLDYLKRNKNNRAIGLPDNKITADLEGSIINKDLAKHIQNLSEGLPEKQRIIFVLKDLQDLSIEEISQILKISTGLVKSNLYYARRRLRENFIKMEQRRVTYEVQ